MALDEAGDAKMAPIDASAADAPPLPAAGPSVPPRAPAAGASFVPESKLAATHRALRRRLLGVRVVATRALAHGFAAAQPPSLAALLGAVSVETLMLAGAAGRDLSAEELLGTIAFEGFDSAEAPDAWHTPTLLVEWLRAIAPLQRRRFVLLVTGRVTPAAPDRPSMRPEGGRLESGREGFITIRYAHESDHLLPRALRAAWELLLPAYADKAALAAAMDAALRRSLPESYV